MNDVFLVTGGEGFIGRNIISKLRNLGGEAYSLDIVGKPDFKVSITNRSKLENINKKFDGIFHLAAVTSPPEFEIKPGNGLRVNVNGTFNVLDFAGKHGVNKVVLASSSAIYGDSREIAVESKYPDRYLNLYPVTKIVDELFSRHYSLRRDLSSASLRYFNTYGPSENTKGAYASPISKFITSALKGKDIEIFGDGTQSRYLNLYPVTKIIDELFSRHYSIRRDLSSVSLRYFNTYGPSENTKGAYASPISKFITSALKGKDIQIFGDGTQSRDFIYVKDTAAASIAAYEKGKTGESYNVGTGTTTSFNQIATMVKSICESESRIVHVKNPFKNYQMFTQADMRKTFKELRFKPTYDLKGAIREMTQIELRSHNKNVK